MLMKILTLGSSVALCSDELGKSTCERKVQQVPAGMLTVLIWNLSASLQSHLCKIWKKFLYKRQQYVEEAIF